MGAFRAPHAHGRDSRRSITVPVTVDTALEISERLRSLPPTFVGSDSSVPANMGHEVVPLSRYAGSCCVTQWIEP